VNYIDAVINNNNTQFEEEPRLPLTNLHISYLPN